MSELERYEKLLVKADADSKRACEARGKLGLETTRARMTTANARWMRAAEYRDRIAAKVDELREAAKPKLVIERPDGTKVEVAPNKAWGM